MKKINKKKCPKCNSLNVFDRGDRIGDVIDLKDTEGKIPKPQHLIYECKDCGELFVFKEKSKN